MKQRVSYRLSDDAREMLDRLADEHGYSRTGVLERLIREAARQGDLGQMRPLSLAPETEHEKRATA